MGEIISRPAPASFREYKFRRIMEMFLDILSVMGSLNLSFQLDSMDVGHLKERVERTKELLESTSEHGGLRGNEYIRVPGEPGHPSAQVQNIFGDGVVPMGVTAEDRAFCVDARKFVCARRAGGISARFPSCDQIDALAASSPENFPNDPCLYDDYGAGLMNAVVKHICPGLGIRPLDLLSVWALREKRIRASCPKSTPSGEMKASRQILLRYTANRLHSFRKKLILGSVLPLQTAVVERTFSRMNLAKDRKTKRMASDLLNDLLACSLIPKEIDMVDVLRMWLKAKKRNGGN